MWNALQTARWFNDDENENLRIGAEIVAMRGRELSRPLNGNYRIVGLVLPEQEAKELAREYGTEISHVYTDNVVLMAGSEEKMDEVLEKFSGRILPVTVKTPFHTSHVQQMGAKFGKHLSAYLKQHPEVINRLTEVGKEQESDVISDIDGRILRPMLLPLYAANHVSSHLDLHQMVETLEHYNLPIISVGISEKATKSVGHGLGASL